MKFCSFNNYTLQNWNNGKAFNIMVSFSQHDLRLVVSGHCLRILVLKFQDKFTSLRQVNSPNSWEMFQILHMLYKYVFDKISTEFCSILHGFVNFAALWPRKISEALTMSCVIYMIKTGH